MLGVWVECCFTSTETVGLLGTGDQDGHLDFHTAPELWIWRPAVPVIFIASAEIETMDLYRSMSKTAGDLPLYCVIDS